MDMKKLFMIVTGFTLLCSLSACSGDRYADYKSPQGRCNAIYKDVEKEGGFAGRNNNFSRMPKYIQEAAELYPECELKRKFILYAY